MRHNSKVVLSWRSNFAVVINDRRRPFSATYLRPLSFQKKKKNYDKPRDFDLLPPISLSWLVHLVSQVTPTMTTDQSARHQKRSRTNDGIEKVASSGDARAKRRRTSESNHTQHPDTSLSNLSENFILQDTEKQKGLAPWSFSQPVGGRYNNADPILTMDEA